MLVTQVQKQPTEVLRHTIDYTCRFDAGQTITELAVAVELDNGDASGLIVDGFILSDATGVEYFVASGNDGETHKITFVATISDGQVMEDEVECLVEEH